MQLAHLMVFVTDLDEARRFYGEVLGFPLKQATDTMLLHDTPAEGPLGRYAAFVDPCGNVHELCEEKA
jgi:catechol 2,3-dioxygenase-like lactoylglutathione lyase family enzyme